MQVLAKYKYARFSPQKARLVVDQIRGLPVERAINILKFSKKRAAVSVLKALSSAIANAENNFGADVDELFVSTAFVDQGPTFKRLMPRAKGRADRILKRTSHITVVVSDEQQEDKE